MLTLACLARVTRHDVSQASSCPAAPWPQTSEGEASNNRTCPFSWIVHMASAPFTYCYMTTPNPNLRDLKQQKHFLNQLATWEALDG